MWYSIGVRRCHGQEPLKPFANIADRPKTTATATNASPPIDQNAMRTLCRIFCAFQSLVARRQLLLPLRMKLLQGIHLRLSALQGGNSLARSPSGGERSDRRYARSDGSSANGLLIEPWLDAVRRVDDELDALTLDQVDDIGPAFFHLVHAFHVQPGVLQHPRGGVRSDDTESQLDEALRQLGHERLVALIAAHEDRS